MLYPVSLHSPETDAGAAFGAADFEDALFGSTESAAGQLSSGGGGGVDLIRRSGSTESAVGELSSGPSVFGEHVHDGGSVYTDEQVFYHDGGLGDGGLHDGGLGDGYFVDEAYDAVDRNWVRYRPGWSGVPRVALFTLVVMFSVFWLWGRIHDWIGAQIDPSGPLGPEVEFTVAPGSSLNDIAADLGRRRCDLQCHGLPLLVAVRGRDHTFRAPGLRFGDSGAGGWWCVRRERDEGWRLHVQREHGL